MFDDSTFALLEKSRCRPSSFLWDRCLLCRMKDLLVPFSPLRSRSFWRRPISRLLFLFKNWFREAYSFFFLLKKWTGSFKASLRCSLDICSNSSILEMNIFVVSSKICIFVFSSSKSATIHDDLSLIKSSSNGLQLLFWSFYVTRYLPNMAVYLFMLLSSFPKYLVISPFLAAFMLIIHHFPNCELKLIIGKYLLRSLPWAVYCHVNDAKNSAEKV